MAAADTPGTAGDTSAASDTPGPPQATGTGPGTDLTGRVALVTGAGQGIGAAVARALHAAGARVALLDIAATAHQVAAELDPRHDTDPPPDTVTAMGVRADVADADQLTAAVERVRERWGAPDILVNNAARTATGSLWDVDLDEWDAVLATNLRSQLVATRLCAVPMRERGWGRVVNLASLAGQQGGLVAGPHYAASKAGIIVLTKMFAAELAPYGVTVNAVAPAAVRTPVMDTLPESRIAEIAAALPVGRVGRVEEVAAMVTYLCGDAAGFVTGATLDINGGLHMR